MRWPTRSTKSIEELIESGSDRELQDELAWQFTQPHPGYPWVNVGVVMLERELERRGASISIDELKERWPGVWK